MAGSTITEDTTTGDITNTIKNTANSPEGGDDIDMVKPKNLSKETRDNRELYVVALLVGVVGNLAANWIWELTPSWHYVLGAMALILVGWVARTVWPHNRRQNRNK